jgi:hypothetical protein
MRYAAVFKGHRMIAYLHVGDDGGVHFDPRMLPLKTGETLRLEYDFRQELPSEWTEDANGPGSRERDI